jgi:thiosulfate/3-mercaptopyruvate sulfurtransferase
LSSVSFGPLIDAGWLARHLGDLDLRLIDFRWYQDDRTGRGAYEWGHIHGAVFVDLDGGVTGRVQGAGLHPLPDRASFQRAMRAAGVSGDSNVVVYDDDGGYSAGRLWWLLRYFGHQRVAVLDGGLQAWDGPLSAEPVQPLPGDFVAAVPRDDMKVDYDEVRSLMTNAVLLDGRRPQKYRGEYEPRDRRPGHSPGARNAHWRGNLRPDRRFKPPEELRQRFTELGVGAGRDMIMYCGSGITACHNLLALELAGLPAARLYPGSWSDWSARPDAPVATGDESINDILIKPLKGDAGRLD